MSAVLVQSIDLEEVIDIYIVFILEQVTDLFKFL